MILPRLLRAGGIVWVAALFYLGFATAPLGLIIYGGLGIGIFLLSWMIAERMENP